MNTIPSFEIDHTKLTKGIYISRIDDDITTYDIRMRNPNREIVMTTASVHTIEHLFATYVRNGEFADKVIYFGPMGCRTGFYFLTRALGNVFAIDLIKHAFKYIGEYNGIIPGATIKGCGNYKDHDLIQAKKDANAFYDIIKSWNVDDLKYPK